MKQHHFLESGLIGNSLAVLAGMSLTLAFAPFSFFPLAIFSPAVLLLLLTGLTPRQSFVRAWLFGAGFFGTGVYWVFISIHTYGNASILLAGIITAVFISLLALFIGLTGYLFNRCFPNPTHTTYLFGFPAIWTLIEWIRSWLFTGFPWLLLGDSQLNSPLKYLAPLLGVYGVSLITLTCSGLLLNAYLKAKSRHYQSMAYYLIAIVTIGAISAALSSITWTKPIGKPVQVSLIQGNIAQEVKWSYNNIAPTLALYQDLSSKNWESNIIVWPEDAVPLSLQTASEYIDQISDEAKKHNSTVITGIPVRNGNENNYFNAVVAVGNDYSYYLKRRLVPFGEYTPFPGLLTSVMQRFNIPMSAMIPNPQTEIKPLLIQGLKIAAFICYEIAFPEQVRSNDEDVNMLLTVSNDGWFGRSIAQAQHLGMAQMRSLELAKPALFVSNTGITAIIKPNGNIQSRLPPHQVSVLTDTVQPMTGKTRWQTYGMDPVLLLTFSFLFTSYQSQRKVKKKAS